MEIKVKVIFKSMSAAGALGLFAPEENTKRKWHLNFFFGWSNIGLLLNTRELVGIHLAQLRLLVQNHVSFCAGYRTLGQKPKNGMLEMHERSKLAWCIWPSGFSSTEIVKWSKHQAVLGQSFVCVRVCVCVVQETGTRFENKRTKGDPQMDRRNEKIGRNKKDRNLQS